MHDLPRQKLTELLAQYGHGFCDDEKRLEAMLKDLLRNDHKRETFVLISALREGVVQDLRAPTAGMPLAAVTAKLIRQLCDNLALDESAARWGVESWAFALGVKITQPVVRVKKTAPLPIVVPASPPTVSPNSGIDLATMVLQQRAKEEQEKQHAALYHRRARQLADDANDYDTAIQLIESLDPKWRDQQLYLSIRERRDQELESQAKQHAAEVHRQAKQHAEKTRDFAAAARMIETLEPQQRDAKLYEKVCGYRAQVASLDAYIHNAVQKGRLQFLRKSVRELFKLQPQRDDMRRLLDVLPEDPELEKEFTNSIGMRFIYIQPGEFTMGSNESDNERPPHLVRITRPFYLGMFPVMQDEYLALTGGNPSHFKGNRCPVETISWDDAKLFCEKMSQLRAESKRDLTFRLPTEAEWEYACRAGSTDKWCFGNNTSLLDEYAWFDVNAEGRTHPVGEKVPNAWGLHDMHGNVSEWCKDGYASDYYKSSPTDDPCGVSMARHRTYRGGGWNLGALSCRSANRGANTPDSQRHYIGFRVAAVHGEG